MRVLLTVTVVALLSQGCSPVCTVPDAETNLMIPTSGPGFRYVFAGTNSGVFRSTDSGATWHVMTTPAKTFAAGFAVGGNNLYVATNYGVLRSIDDGLNWVTTGALPGTGTESVYIYGPYLFAGTPSNGVCRSSDYGQTWTRFFLGGFRCFASKGRDLIAGTDDEGFILSTDSGANWQPFNNGLPTMSISGVAIQGTYFIAGTDNLGLLRSYDRGLTWHSMDPGTPYISTIWSNGNTMIAGTDRATIRSTDAGQTWQYLGDAFSGVASSIAVSGSFIFEATRAGGVKRSTDAGVTWEKIDTGLTESYIYGIGLK
ncbi:MAG: hypothetical protein Q8922_09390 [Bacteroidota bacterium]|nr:hypothetical protein [Bacteroidota bacterium]MDP4234248.1 hypothetical protein [Bacteroidota bacterium]MDP4243438.1 hypothetical protein [Bacteroidota bacterium]MDP4288137.1 hypothetical protein [Bacteroidota bacterium]